MKIEEESEEKASKTVKGTDGKPSGEGEPGPEAGTAPPQESCKVFSLDEYRSARKKSTATET